MTMRTVRFKVRRGHLEPLEPVNLVEGSEVEVSVSLADTANEPAQPAVAFRSWKMGVKEPLTREDIYEDVG